MTHSEVVCFGEVLLRLNAPNSELLLQTGLLHVHVGGAEANVATGLANLGHRTAMVSAVADNALGRAATGELRRHGVDVGSVVAGPERMGLYFLTPGAGLRPSEIIYDRAHSAFAAGFDVDWPRVLDGATWLHLSGITPALGPATAAAAHDAVVAAKAAGVRVSFDCNYRARLWEAWDSDPRATLTGLIENTDLLFGNHRDVALLLGRAFDGEGSARRREAALAAFEAFPNLATIASTARHLDDVDRHRLSARIDTRRGEFETGEVVVTGIVDRLGTGDAFATGVLHGLLTGTNDADTARAGLALACLKHSLPGDASLFTRGDLAHFAEGSLDVRR